MAEAIGLVASVIAIGGVAGKACEGATSIYHYLKTIKAAQAQINSFAKDVAAFGSAVRLAHFSLEQHTQPTQNPSNVIVYVESENILQTLVDQSQDVTEGIESLELSIQGLCGKMKPWARVKWMFQKGEAVALRPRMAGVTTNIQLLVAVVEFEFLRDEISSGRGSPEIERRLKHVEEQIELHMQTIASDQTRLHQNLMAQGVDEARLLKLISTGVETALVRLGVSMVDHGTVPPTTRGSPSSTVSQDRRTPSPVTPNTQRHAVRRRRTPRSPRPLSSPERAHSFQSEELAPLPLRDSRVSPPPPASPAPEPSELLQKHNDGESSIPPARPRPRPDGNIPSRPHSYLVNLNPSHNTQSINGVILTPSGFTAATALLIEDLQNSIISQAFAAKLGLDVEIHEGEPVLIEFEDGNRERSIGQVILEWNKSENSHRRPFEVRCLVCEHDVRSLVFGKNFLDERDLRWERRSNAS